MRIQGLIAVTNRVRDQLKVGIPPEKVEHFQQYVRHTLETVEGLCAEARMKPSQLPTPSRKAYAYLKQLDLNALPIAAATADPTLTQTIHLRNIRSKQQHIHVNINDLAKQSPLSTANIQKLHQVLTHNIGEIDKILAQTGLTSSQLAGQGKPFYGWLAFLVQGNNLFLHIEAVQRFQNRLKTIAAEPNRKQPIHPTHVQVDFSFINGLYRYRIQSQKTEIHLSEGFMTAEDIVFDALIQAILGGKTAPSMEILKRYSVSAPFTKILNAFEQNFASNGIAAQGHAYDLETLFHQVNKTYFQGKMEKPQMSWNQVFTRRKFGHYEPSRDRIEISMTLDNPKIPAYVAEFVLYHELLHKHHRETWVNGKQMVHTPAFRQDEQQFQYYTEAEDWLKKLARAQ
jgi:hypothetical protein